MGTALVLSGRLRNARKSISRKGDILSFCAHNPNKVLLEKVVRWLIRRGYHFISSDELLAILKERRVTKDLVWLSFDDGWKDNLVNVIPILEKYRIPATFFVSTGEIERGYFWFEFARQNRGCFPGPLRTLWEVSNAQRVSMIEAAEKDANAHIVNHTLSPLDIQTLSRNPFVTFGNHTDGHAICVYCSDDELADEIGNCSRKLHGLTGRVVRYFAYPNGDYNGRVVETARSSGIELAATIEPRAIRIDDDLYRVPRCPMLDDGGLHENLCHIFGVWQPAMRKLKHLFRGRSEDEASGGNVVSEMAHRHLPD